MAKINIPNEPVLNFTGKPIRTPLLDDDLEVVYKPLKCQASACEFSTKNIGDLRDHLRNEHAVETLAGYSFAAEEVDLTAARALMLVLIRFNQAGSREAPNPLNQVRKTNDGMHADRVWAAAYNALKRADANPEKVADVRLAKEQYDWLHQLLDRKLPLAKDERDRGVEQETVVMHLFNLADDSVKRSLTTPSERAKVERDDPVEISA